MAAPEDTREYSGTQSFWKQGMIYVLEIHIVKLDVGSYLHTTPEKCFKKVEKEKKDKHLQSCPGHSHIPLLYSTRSM